MKMLIKPASGKTSDSPAKEQPVAIAEVVQSTFPAEIESVRQQYCASSGRPLSIVPADIVSNLITIHGTQTAIKILQTQQIKYSYDWIWLNQDGLESLAEHRPAEYFIYATSKLLQDVTLHSELMRLHEAAEAWRSLQDIDSEIIIPINELLRRLLAGYKRNRLNKHLLKLVNTKVNAIASSIDNLLMFQMELTDLIQTLIANRKASDAVERGMSNFRAQRMIKALSALEVEVGIELNDFDIVHGKSSEVIHGITGTQYRHSHINHDLATQEKILTAEPDGGFSVPMKKQKAFAFKLKIGGNK